MKEINFRLKKSNELEFRRRGAFFVNFFASFPVGREIHAIATKVGMVLKTWKARIIMDRFKLEDLDDTNLKTNDPYNLS